ncbi:MAG: Cof-type HAD-IIB family hydrolase [Anaerostipes sp.]|nr:Cof-type HAD-IIB family hydrolase [Anaerostipes sp.]
MIRLLASDMDGTLLNSHRQISEENINAIKQLQEHGIEFIISTGREHQSVKELLKDTDIHCDMICANGAATYDKDDNVLFQHFIEKDKVRQIFDTLREYDMVPNIFTESGKISAVPPEELRTYIQNVMIPSFQVNHPDFVYTKEDIQSRIDETTFVPNEESIINGDDKVLKIISTYPNPDVLVPVREALKKIPGLAVSYTTHTDVEVTTTSAQKGIALSDYAKKKGYDFHEMVAVGDSDNDYSMLSLPHIHSVAMANASPHIKEICTYQTRQNTDDGIAYIIRCILTDRQNFKLR